MTGKDVFKDWKGASAKKPEEVLTPPDPDEPEQAADGCGMSTTRGMLAGVRLEMENGDVHGVYYGAILGSVNYNRSLGIRFVYEDHAGCWQVSIAGRNLDGLHRDLILMRRETIRYGESVTEISIVKAEAAGPQPRPATQ